MKAQVKLALQQAAMRARPHCRRSEKTPAVEFTELRRRIAATILVYERGYNAVQIANEFHWPREDVERWLQAGKPLK